MTRPNKNNYLRAFQMTYDEDMMRYYDDLEKYCDYLENSLNPNLTDF